MVESVSLDIFYYDVGDECPRMAVWKGGNGMKKFKNHWCKSASVRWKQIEYIYCSFICFLCVYWPSIEYYSVLWRVDLGLKVWRWIHTIYIEGQEIILHFIVRDCSFYSSLPPSPTHTHTQTHNLDGRNPGAHFEKKKLCQLFELAVWYLCIYEV